MCVFVYIKCANLQVLTVGPLLPGGPIGPSSPCRNKMHFILQQTIEIHLCTVLTLSPKHEGVTEMPILLAYQST